MEKRLVYLAASISLTTFVEIVRVGPFFFPQVVWRFPWRRPRLFERPWSSLCCRRCMPNLITYQNSIWVFSKKGGKEDKLVNFFFPGKFYSHREVTLWLDFAKAVDEGSDQVNNEKRMKRYNLKERSTIFCFIFPRRRKETGESASGARSSRTSNDRSSR